MPLSINHLSLLLKKKKNHKLVLETYQLELSRHFTDPYGCLQVRNQSLGHTAIVEGVRSCCQVCMEVWSYFKNKNKNNFIYIKVLKLQTLTVSYLLMK